MRLVVISALAATLAASGAPAQDASRLTIDRIFRSRDFASAPLPSVHWLADGQSYVDLRPAEGGGTDVIRVDLVTGRESVLVPASRLVGSDGKRIAVEELTLSEDESKALLFHNSVRVWRQNTRGRYHVVDLRTGGVTAIGAVSSSSARPAERADTTPDPYLGKQPSFLARGLQSGAVDSTLQMFAKFSPDGRMVAYVQGNDLWVSDLSTGQARRLTMDGGDDIINGTSDWVYEEELGLRDAFRWSPDSRRIAYWRFDQRAVPAFPMVDELGGYPTVGVLRYPKAGAPNSRVRVGVLALGDGKTTWLAAGPDTGQYIARMEWAGADSVIVQRMPRKQNRVDLLMLSAATGQGRTVLTDRDSAYVDVEGDALVMLDGGKRFLWRSDRSGWRQIYLFDRAGRQLAQITQDGMDVLEVAAVDEKRGEVYVVAAAPTPSQRQLYRVSLRARRAPVRVTTQPGSHAPTIGPGARWMVDIHSTASQPATATLYELPSGRQVRALADNAKLRATLAALAVRAPEFFPVPMPDGTKLDAYRIVPANFDSTRKYPVLMYVYGGPASPTVNDSWGGSRYLWHQLLAQQGYVVVSVDNRGAAWRGRDFRKVTQYHLGMRESQDQMDAAKWLARQPWVDGARIGIWGWSYGGFMSAMSAFRGGELFRAALAVAPVTDWRLYDTIYTERFMWTPQENAEGYRESAPLAHAAGLTASFLVVHGTGDDNVHAQNTTQLANALQAAGKPFQMMLYPNRTHSISGGNTQAHLYDMMTRFVKERL